MLLKLIPYCLQAILNSHFYDGGFYPVGGASEIALNIIPVIERAGGRVLVRANVTEILVRLIIGEAMDKL
jgi:all-trans-retinol 13,14-reductase